MTITEIVKKILAKMAQLKIPLTPSNYQLWFEYYAGGNDELKADINRTIASGEPFTKEVCEILHDKHFGKDRDDRLIQQVQQATVELITAALEEVLTTSQDASQYTEKLRDYSRVFADISETPEIRAAILNVIRDTRTMSESSLRLQRRLEETKEQAEQLRRRLARTEQEAQIDFLTGLHNRRAFERKAEDLCLKFRRQRALFSVLMIDIDHFKQFNDKYGHTTGDEVLKIVASVLHDCLKGADFSARYGGEEFVVVLPMTRAENARIVADQIREEVSEKRLKRVQTEERLDAITVSVGVAEIRPGDTIESVLNRADKALYVAKESGRNQVITENDLKV